MCMYILCLYYIYIYIYVYTHLIILYTVIHVLQSQPEIKSETGQAQLGWSDAAKAKKGGAPSLMCIYVYIYIYIYIYYTYILACTRRAS